jgi:diadenosine tetraphosphate (Ap4A) HIT family hydrolase
MFQLHERLASDTVKVGSFTLCEVLLMNDAHYPWIILVPGREGISEIHQLNERDQTQLLKESVFVAGKMQVHYQADKMNIAALGNVVPQLHIHHIARYTKDMAWPKPVWGFQAALAYDAVEMEVTLASLRALFAEMLV